MSSSCCVASVGLRFEIQISEIELLESRRDPRQIAAKTAGLDAYWTNFGGLKDRCVLLVGSRLGIVGPEDLANIQFSSEHLSNLLAETAVRLKSVGLAGPVTLNLEWLADS